MAGWVVANALSDAWSLASSTWGWLPPEWFDLHLLISRADRELATLDTSVDAIHARVDGNAAKVRPEREREREEKVPIFYVARAPSVSSHIPLPTAWTSRSCDLPQSKELTLYRKNLDSYLKKARDDILKMAEQRADFAADLDAQVCTRGCICVCLCVWCVHVCMHICVHICVCVSVCGVYTCVFCLRAA